ncbi:MAG TPA: hypothetical protein VL053_08485 [Arachidicoccus sp.]|nr:hypothetical protein [Arachidicoccus sp.]
MHAVLHWAQPNPKALDELETLEQPFLIALGKEDKPVPVENSINMSKNRLTASLFSIRILRTRPFFSILTDFRQKPMIFC